MTVSREGALAEYEVAVERRGNRYRHLQQALDDYADAKADAVQKLYEAILSVPCPVESCGAEVDQPCTEVVRDGLPFAGQRRKLGRLAQHGVRQDLSGVHGEKSRERQLAKVGS